MDAWGQDSQVRTPESALGWLGASAAMSPASPRNPRSTNRRDISMHIKRVATALGATALLAVGLSACTTDADVVNKNISQDADNFKVPRRITFINGITDKVELEVTGYCSVDPNDALKITVTCARNGGYIRQYLLKSDNVFGVIDQLEPAQVSPNYYHSTIKPTTVIPDIELR